MLESRGTKTDNVWNTWQEKSTLEERETDHSYDFSFHIQVPDKQKILVSGEKLNISGQYLKQTKSLMFYQRTIS